MKVLALVLSTVIATILETAAIVAVVFASPNPRDIPAGLFVMATIAVGAFFYGPIMLGSATFYWDFGSSDGSRRYLRRLLIVLLAVDVLAIAAIILFTVVTRAAIWLPIALIVLAALLMVAAPALGRALRRYDDKHGKGQPAWMPVEATAIRRKIRAIIITFGVALIVTFALFAVLNSDEGVSSRIWVSLGFAFEFACIAAAFAAIILTFSMARAMRAATGRDPSVARKVAKVVLRGKNVHLTDEEQRAAAKYAPAAAVYLPFMLAYISLLYLGIGLQRVVSLVTTPARDHDPVFDTGFLVFLAVVLVIFFPLYIIRARRARAYAEAHAALAQQSALAE